MSCLAAVKRLWSNPDLLGIEWTDGTSSEFASIWLRDNLRGDRDLHSGQRLVDIADLPENPRIRPGPRCLFCTAPRMRNCTRRGP